MKDWASSASTRKNHLFPRYLCCLSPPLSKAKGKRKLSKTETIEKHAPTESRPLIWKNEEEAILKFVDDSELAILSTNVSYTTAAERKFCEEEFLHFEKKILKLQNDLVTSQNKVLQELKEKEKIALHLNETMEDRNRFLDNEKDLELKLVASEKKAVEEEALCLKVFELSFALMKKDSELSSVLEKKESKHAEIVKAATDVVVKEYKDSFDFKK
ncbi:unnamed protein product [Ilex paraguariensis]|uniref:Uncharacterized protein n=1 Tax=Ilex paraguariensis TaxID=185542 RepID=A0ABC8ST17_9AQUA